MTLCNSFSLLVASHPSHTERRIHLTYNIDDVTHHHDDRRRLHWTPKLCVDLLHSRDMARQLHSSEDCPRKVNGRRQHKHKCKRRARQLENKKRNTFTKVVPNKTEIKHLERIAVSLVKEDPANKQENYLWECNCAIYSVAMAWKRKDQRNSNDNRYTSNNSQCNLKHCRKLKEVKKIEENMQLCRRELSQLTAEIERIRSNRSFSRKTNHNK